MGGQTRNRYAGAAIGVCVALLAACSGSGDGESAPPDTQATTELDVSEQLPPVTDVVAESTTSTSTTSTTVPAEDLSEPVTIHATDWPDEEAIEPADDPFGFREHLPRLPKQPEARWRIAAPRFTLSFPVAVGDVVTYVSATRENVQTVEARDKLTGELTWTHQIDGFRVETTNVVDGVLVVTWVEPPYGELIVGLDPATGDALWQIPGEERPGLLSMYPRYIASKAEWNNPVSDALDPRTLESLGRFSPGFGGHRGPLRVEGSTLTELDPVTFATLGDPVDIGLDVLQLEGLVTTPTAIVAYDEGELIAFHSDGTRIASLAWSDIDTPDLLTVGPTSDLVVLSYFGYATAFDMTTGFPVWERDVVLRRFGSVDGEILATSAIYDPDEIGSATGETTELFSLETGRTRCMLDVFAGSTRHGLYADGTAYDLDCRPMWTLPADADGDQALVDEGVLRWKRIGDNIELLFFGDPAATSKA